MKNEITAAAETLRNLIRSLFTTIQQRIDDPYIRQSTLQAIPYWLGAALTALIAVGYAKIIGLLESMTIQIVDNDPWKIFLMAPAAFLVAWWVVYRFAPDASGSGIPQLMAAIELDQERDKPRLLSLLGIRTAIVKFISSALCIFGGGAIGREGPTLQISGAAFYFVGRVMPKSWPRINLQSMIIAGGAAGLAAAFNTPLGGIVYVIEELAKVHLSMFKTAVLQAVIVAGLVAQLVLGPYLYLGYPKVSALSLSQLPWIALVGLLAGFAGAGFGRGLFRIVRLRDTLTSTRSRAAFTLVCGLLFAALIFTAGSVSLGSGREVIEKLLFSSETNASGVWVFSRVAGSLLTYASGTAGGIFAPSLAIGATIGSFLAHFLQFIDTNVLILVGMVGFLTAVTGTPFTSFVLVLEMTDRHSVLFPMMIAAVAAHAASKVVDRKTFYEKMKHRFMRSAPRTKSELLAQTRAQ